MTKILPTAAWFDAITLPTSDYPRSGNIEDLLACGRAVTVDSMLDAEVNPSLPCELRRAERGPYARACAWCSREIPTPHVGQLYCRSQCKRSAKMRRDWIRKRKANREAPGFNR